MTTEPTKKWTPGPWTLAVPEMGFSAIYGRNGELVFGLAAGSADERQAENVCDANARLIAASPRIADYIIKRAQEGDAEAREIFDDIL